VIDAIDEVFQAESDDDLVDEFTLRYLFPLDPTFHDAMEDYNSQDITLLLKNLRAFYDSIPDNSPIRTSIIRTLFHDLPAKFISSFLGVDISSVYKATSDEREVPELRFYLTQLEFLRNRLGEREKTLFDWFIVRCTVPSGRNKRYYRFGTPESMWLEYASYCMKLSEDYIDEKLFHEIRKRERVGIIKADIFMNPLKQELSSAKSHLEELEGTKKPWSAKVTSEINVARKLIADIEKRLEWCNQRKLAYKQAHGALENDPETAVITLDFYGTGKTTVSQGDHDGDLVDLIVVIATKEELELPESLLADQIEAVAPISSFAPDIAVKLITPVDRTPQRSYSKAPKEITSHVKSIKQQRMARKLAPLDTSDIKYVPALAYFHCISKKKLPGNISVKQTHDFLMYFLNFLLCTHNLLCDIGNFKIWSDGCGKHFKTYTSQFYISILQLKLEKKITWDFLPPNDAHNRADAQAGTFSQIINRAISNSFILTEIEHLLAISQHMKNCYKFEALHFDFPEHLSVSTKDSFIQDTFTISYGVPSKQWIGCEHKCQNKGTYI
jgi:hypothetical protein